jgi:hypothetical protein
MKAEGLADARLAELRFRDGPPIASPGGTPGTHRACSRLRAALDRADAAGVAVAAQTLKGAIGNLPARKAFRAAERLEMLAREGNLVENRLHRGRAGDRRACPSLRAGKAPDASGYVEPGQWHGRTS